MGALLARDLSLHTLHAHTCTYRSHTDARHTHAHPKRDKCEGSVAGSDYDHEECQPRAVV